MSLSHLVVPSTSIRYGFPSRKITASPVHSLCSQSQPSLRCAVIGAGFAGLAVVWHLLKNSPKSLDLKIDLYDEVGIGGGASGIAGGLLHPYSPKVKLLWEGGQCWNESINLLRVAEEVANSRKCKVGKSSEHMETFVAHRSGRQFSHLEQPFFFFCKRGILRPAMDMKNLTKLNDNVRTCLPSCRIETLNTEEVQNLVPGLCLPLGAAFFMPEAFNIHSQHYLQTLFWACENLVKESSIFGSGHRQLSFHKRSISGLLEFEGEYDAVIICLGAKVNMLPEISGRLPLRTCRGVVLHMELPEDTGEGYPDLGPSILSDAWIAVQGPRSLHVGSTWDWKSQNSSPNVTADEASKALGELLPKASTIYPGMKEWVYSGARAGLRAMPPLTSLGSLPLLGCINDLIGINQTCKYWLFGGLGSRGLLYHGWLGNIMAQAVLSCNELLIPSELVSWKNIKP